MIRVIVFMKKFFFICGREGEQKGRYDTLVIFFAGICEAFGSSGFLICTCGMYGIFL